MMGFICVLGIDLACLASGTFLVHTQHYGWAWIPFLIAACTSYKHTKDKDKP